MQPKKKYNLTETYGQESNLNRYIRLTVGENKSIGSLFLHELLFIISTGLPGLLGIGLRKFLYPKFFKGISKSSFIGKHVTLRCPSQIKLGSGVMIDDFTQLVANSSHPDAIIINSGSFLRSQTNIVAGPPEGFVHIGENTGIGQGTILYGNGGLTIGNKVLIAGQCFIVASMHEFKDPNVPIAEQGISTSGITIEDNVWIGAGAKILDGVTIGEGAIVGANAVVTKSVEPHTRVVGIPAKPLANKK